MDEKPKEEKTTGGFHLLLTVALMIAVPVALMLLLHHLFSK